MRATFSQCLTQAAKENPNTVLLTGDHGYALFDEFRRECPGQYINAGIAEQNMVGVAAGLAKTGFFPIVYGLSAFVPIRVLEQIKMDLCYQKLPALLIGDGAGVVYGQLGASHQSTEDVAALRGVPHITIYSPADRTELLWCFNEALHSGRTSYLRFGKADLGAIHPQAGASGGEAVNVSTAPRRLIGNGSEDIALIATGSMLKSAHLIASELERVALWSVPRLKPLAPEELDPLIQGYKKVAILEEHSIYGGLGSIVCERIATLGASTKALLLGINDQFSELCGSYPYLIGQHGLGMETLRRKIIDFTH